MSWVKPERPYAPPRHPASPPAHAGAPVFETDVDRDFAGRPMANWGYRVGAFVVDLCLVIIAAIVAGQLADVAGADPDAIDTTAGFAGLGAWLINSTVGRRSHGWPDTRQQPAGTRIVRENGRRARYGTGFLRDFVLRFLYLVPLVFLVDSLLALGDKRQSLRDKIVSPRVLQEPVYRSRRWPLTAAALLLVAGLSALAAATGTEGFTQCDAS